MYAHCLQHQTVDITGDFNERTCQKLTPRTEGKETEEEDEEGERGEREARCEVQKGPSG